MTVTAGNVVVTAGIVTVVAGTKSEVVFAQALKDMTTRSSERNNAINNLVFIFFSLELLSCTNKVVV